MVITMVISFFLFIIHIDAFSERALQVAPKYSSL